MQENDRENSKELPEGIYLRGGNYWINYTFVDQRGVKKYVRMSADTTNLRVAQKILEKKRTEAAENKHLDIRKDEKILFRDFEKLYLDRHAFKNKGFETDKHQLKAIEPFLGHKYLHEITVLDLEKFRSERLQHVKVATVNRNMALIKSMLNRAVEWEMLRMELNPAPKIKQLPENNMRLRFLSKDEIEKLYKQCNGELLALVKVAINTGMRRGELMALTWNDIDMKGRQIYIRDSKSGKGRVIPMNDTVWNVFLSLEKLPEKPYIFASTHREAYVAALKRAEIKDATFHTLRHTAASHLAQAGVNLFTISKILGHSTTEMTARYAHLGPDYMARSIYVLDQVFGVSEEKFFTNFSQSGFLVKEPNLQDYVSPSLSMN